MIDPKADAHAVNPEKLLAEITGIGYRAESIIALLLQAKIPLSQPTYQALGMVHDALGDLLGESTDED